MNSVPHETFLCAVWSAPIKRVFEVASIASRMDNMRLSALATRDARVAGTRVKGVWMCVALQWEARAHARSQKSKESPKMWPGSLGVVVLVVILVGVAGLTYLVMRTSGAMLLPRRTDERDTRDVERHTPH